MENKPNQVVFPMRLQKFMAMCGVGSRRKCEEYILAGRVNVNGEMCSQLGTTVSQNDVIEYEGTVISFEERKRYILYHKPMSMVATVTDPRGRPTVLDAFSGEKERVYPVGRLDYDTQGLLLLTNDGDFAYCMMHPSHEITKEYLARVHGVPTDNAMMRLREGVMLDEKLTAPAEAEILSVERGMAWVKVVIHEGRNRQVRRMFDEIGHSAVFLQRQKYGDISLDGVEIGAWRELTQDEVDGLLGSAGGNFK